MPETTIHLYNPPTLHKPNGYSHVGEVRRGRMLYIAGQVAIDPSGAIVGPNDVRAQIEQVFRNLQAALDSAGATFADVVKLNIYCVDSVPAEQLPIVREVRDRFVNTAAPPASTFVFVSRLVRPEWLIEVEAVAAVVA